MLPKSFNEVLRGVLTIGALGVTSYLAIIGNHEAAGGALIGLLGLVGSYEFRGKVQPPSN